MKLVKRLVINGIDKHFAHCFELILTGIPIKRISHVINLLHTLNKAIKKNSYKITKKNDKNKNKNDINAL